jgi:hypothetical protein
MNLPNNQFLYFFCHYPQHLWYPVFEEAFLTEKNMASVVITLGKEERLLAEVNFRTKNVFNILEGYDPEVSDENVDEKLEEFYENTETGFWEDVQQDRWLWGKYSDNFIKTYAIWIISQLQEKFEKYPPYAAVGEKNSLPYRIFHHFSKKLNFPHYTLLLSRNYVDRFYFEQSIFWQWTSLKNMFENRVFQELSGEEQKNITTKIEHIRKNKSFVGLTKSRGNKDSLKIRQTKLKERLLEKDNPRAISFLTLIGLNKIVNEAKKLNAIKGYKRLSKNVLPKKFVLYLLHVQPEYTIDGLGHWVKNQVEFIRVVASSLPAGVSLVVKEHEPSFGQRPANYYTEIASIPNVVLLSLNWKGSELVEKANMVVTVTGTVALEGILKFKPVICVGRIFYEDFPGIVKISCLSKLPEITREILQEPKLYVAKEEDVKNIFAAMYKASYPGKVACYYFSEKEVSKGKNKKLLQEAFLQEVSSFYKNK